MTDEALVKEEGSTAAQANTLDDTEEFTFDMSIKKKKKKKRPTEEGEAGTESTAATSATTDAGVPIEEAASPLFPTEGGDAVFGEDGISAATGATASPSGNAESWLNSDRDYTYGELLGRVFSILRQNNPDLAGDRRKFTIIPPIIGREGSKKTAFTNISELCRRMRRPVEHVTSFLLTEMGTTGSMDANQRLIIKGRFQQLQVENLLRRYIGEYVTCKTCRSPETQLTKENRLFFMKCDSCGSSRSVAAIKAGFKAQTGRRVRTG